MGTARRSLGIALILALSAGCPFERVDGNPITDGPGPDMEMPPCEGSSLTCSGTMLRFCAMRDAAPIVTPCPWGCVSDAPAHCGRFTPTGSALTQADLDPDAALLARTGLGGGTIDTELGSITNVRLPGMNVVDGIDFEVRSLGGGRDVGVFRVGKLTLQGTWLVRGANALALVSLGDLTIQGVLDLRGDCASNNAGPGGRAGGAPDGDAMGLGGGAGGTGGSGTHSGGGGGAYAGAGGNGGNGGGTTPSGGTVWGVPEISTLEGGAGGGGGGGGGGPSGTGGVGGGGGGAVHIIANGKVTFRNDPVAMPSGLNAGGCGGKGGSQGANGGGGGGGGAGGAILIEAPALELDNAHLAVNGGGGGGGKNTNAIGANGALVPTRASGAPAIGTGDGGDGGASGATNHLGLNGQNDGEAGGGGGGVGRIRINLRPGQTITIMNGAILSPPLDEGTPAPSTKSNATVR